MAAIQRFEDIQAWQKARSLTREIYAITSLKGFKSDFAFRDQIRRASISILSNIAELKVGSSTLNFQLSTFNL